MGGALAEHVVIPAAEIQGLCIFPRDEMDHSVVTSNLYTLNHEPWSLVLVPRSAVVPGLHLVPAAAPWDVGGTGTRQIVNEMAHSETNATGRRSALNRCGMRTTCAQWSMVLTIVVCVICIDNNDHYDYPTTLSTTFSLLRVCDDLSGCATLHAARFGRRRQSRQHGHEATLITGKTCRTRQALQGPLASWYSGGPGIPQLSWPYGRGTKVNQERLTCIMHPFTRRQASSSPSTIRSCCPNRTWIDGAA